MLLSYNSLVFLAPRLSLRCSIPVLISMLAPFAATPASLDVYLSPPGSQSTYFAGATTETFNALPIGNRTQPYVSPIGTYQFSSTARFASAAANQYGGANGSRYVALGAESGSSAPVTLDLAKPANYFGFWWSAGDASNGLSFYYNNILLTRLTTASIVTLLNANQGVVTAIDGTKYTRSSYYGNPNTRQDPSEPFAYVNIFANGTGFNRIVFDNSGSTGTGFESDNHSVLLGHPEPSGASVFVKSTPNIAVFVVPEPDSIALAGMGIMALSFLLRLRRFS